MSRKLFYAHVTNIPESATEADLKEHLTSLFGNGCEPRVFALDSTDEGSLRHTVVCLWLPRSSTHEADRSLRR